MARTIELEVVVFNEDGVTNQIVRYANGKQEVTDVNQLKQENVELRERVKQLETDQELVLQLNQLLLEKLHFLSEDFVSKQHEHVRHI